MKPERRRMPVQSTPQSATAPVGAMFSDAAALSVTPTTESTQTTENPESTGKTNDGSLLSLHSQAAALLSGEQRLLETPPAPPTLYTQSHLEQQVQPGAYRVSPGHPVSGERAEDSQEEESDIAGVEEVGHGGMFSDGQARGHDNLDGAYLVEADLVPDSSIRSATDPPMVLVEALPLRRKNLWPVFGLGSVLILAVAVGVTMGVVTSNNRGVPSTETTRPSTPPSGYPSYQPSSTPSLPPSASPSMAPSSVPSMIPSSMPTREVLTAFRTDLPIYTKEQLTNSSTSQALALDWIANVDRPRTNLRRIMQRFVLATLYFATSGNATWKRHNGWLNSTLNECNWVGCSCTENRTISGLALEDNRLMGTIPKEMSLLENLEKLRVSGNGGLRGTLSREIAKLTALRNFGILDTSISGRLPTEIGLLTRLTTMSFGFSLISGTIPTQIGLLRSLAELDFSYTRIVGPLPSNFGSLTSLTFLNLDANKLSSTIPEEVGNMSSLKYLFLANNSLTGTVPSALWQAPALETINMPWNALNGSISADIRQASRLRILSMAGNDLVSTIPTHTGLLSKLEQLSLEENQLTGTIPTELGLLSSLYGEGLDLHRNKLTGTLPTELGLLSNVQYMNFHENQLRGSVPAQLCALVPNGLDLELDCDKVTCSCGCTCDHR